MWRGTLIAAILDALLLSIVVRLAPPATFRKLKWSAPVVTAVVYAGLWAWVLWGTVHITSLIGFRNRLQVLLSWFWDWLLNARDARLITGQTQLEVRVPHPDSFIPDEDERQQARPEGSGRG